MSLSTGVIVSSNTEMAKNDIPMTNLKNKALLQTLKIVFEIHILTKNTNNKPSYQKKPFEILSKISSLKPNII